MMQQSTSHRAGPTCIFFICSLYLVAATYLGASGIVYLSMVSINVALLVGLAKGVGGRTGTMGPYFLLMVMLAALNLAVTTERQETALRWLLWFEMFFAFGLLATDCDEAVDRSLARLLPFGMAIIWLAKYRAAGSPGVTREEAEVDLHLSAFFASMTVACGLFHPRTAWRWIFCLTGVYGVLVSGSRAAFIFLPLLFLAPALYYFRSRSSAFAVALVPAALLAGFFLNESFRDATFGRKAVAVGADVIDDAEKSMDDRNYLRALAIEMLQSRPLGYGYGNTYVIPAIGNRSRGTNFHNGYMNVGVAMGVPLLALYILFNAWLAWSLYSDSRAPRLFRHLFLSVLVCANLRATTEDFTLFDLGNPVCYLVIYMSFMYLNKRRYMPYAAIP